MRIRGPRDDQSRPRRRSSGSRLLPKVETLEDRIAMSLNLAPLVALQSLTGVVAINGVAVDASGDTYVTGTLSGGSTNLNPDGSSILSVGIGSSEGFLAKYSPQGQFLWDQVFFDDTSSGLDDGGGGTGLALDAQGNPIVTGYYGSAVYAAKFFSTGGNDWAEDFGNAASANPDSGNAVAVDSAGDVYLAGYLSDTSLVFGGTAQTLIRLGTQDMFVVKLSSTGTAIWSWDSGGPGDINTLRGIAVDAAGEAFVTGQVSDSGANSLYIAKLNSSGSFASGGYFGSGAPDTGVGVAIDSQGDVFVVGTLAGTAYWGGDVGTVAYTYPDNLFVLHMNAAQRGLYRRCERRGRGCRRQHRLCDRVFE
jgi:hypothetical protein